MPNEMQSWSNFYDRCDEYYIEEISPKEYMKRMDKIIDKGGAVHETLIALLDEASKLTIKDDVTKQVTKKGKNERHNNQSNSRR
jgi:hypothetical protein